MDISLKPFSPRRSCVCSSNESFLPDEARKANLNAHKRKINADLNANEESFPTFPYHPFTWLTQSHLTCTQSTIISSILMSKTITINGNTNLFTGSKELTAFFHFGLFQFSLFFFTLLYFHFYFIFPIPHLNWRLFMTGVSNVGDDSSSLWNVQSRHVSKRTRLVCLEIHFGNFIDPSFMRHSVLALFLKGHLIKYCFQNNENRKL